MKKNYGYLDKGGILHIVEKKEKALESARNEKVVITDVEGLGGYPVENGVELVVYGLDSTYIEGNEKDGKKVDLKGYPRVYDLYKSLI